MAAGAAVEALAAEVLRVAGLEVGEAEVGKMVSWKKTICFLSEIYIFWTPDRA